MRILIACDHGALELKDYLVASLQKRQDVTVDDLGVHSSDSVDYPDYADALCKGVLAESDAVRGILLCGTGIGISIAANRYPGIRAALCHDECTARLSREHNNANVLVLGGRTTGPVVAEGILDTWLSTAFEGGRHEGRLNKIEVLSQTYRDGK
ncbi:MAG: ribose 5-phosphate isomerase B [Magnetococcales bacterium]|nr:ribose 5-phosphate isomerase B [Magnetococcales bacterium]